MTFANVEQRNKNLICQFCYLQALPFARVEKNGRERIRKMYTVVPYRQANLVQVERVHKGSAQQPRSLEIIFVFNESLSDHFIAFVSFDCCACFEHNSTS